MGKSMNFGKVDVDILLEEPFSVFDLQYCKPGAK